MSRFLSVVRRFRVATAIICIAIGSAAVAEATEPAEKAFTADALGPYGAADTAKTGGASDPSGTADPASAAGTADAADAGGAAHSQERRYVEFAAHRGHRDAFG